MSNYINDLTSASISAVEEEAEAEEAAAVENFHYWESSTNIEEEEADAELWGLTLDEAVEKEEVEAEHLAYAEEIEKEIRWYQKNR